MSALLYVVRKSLKNNLLDLIHHPAKLIVYIFVALLLAFSFGTMVFSPAETETLLDTRFLEGIYLGLLLLVTVPTLLAGMQSGGGMFRMSDVNMLFVAPIPPKRILLYGLARQAGTMLLVAVCMVAYSGMAVNNFGVSIGFALLLLLGYALTLFIVQTVTMLVYSLVNGRPGRIRTAKGILFGLILLLAGVVAVQLYRGGMSMDSAAAAVSHPLTEFFPVAGWVKGLLFAAAAGNWVRAALFGGLLVVGTVMALLLFMRSDADYYEDVLQNAESTYAMKQAAQEGRLSTEQVFGKRKLKVGGTGLRGGWGASAFFYKHLREMRRRSRLLFLGPMTLVLIAIGVFLHLLAGGAEDGMSPNIVLMAVAMAGIYIFFFTSSVGEWGRELGKPYLYLAPCPPFQKVLWASMTSLLKPVAEGTVVFLVVGLVAGGSALTIVMCILLYASFGAVFTSSGLLAQRVLGHMANRGLVAFLYMALLGVLVSPGLVAGIVLGVVLDGVIPGALMGAPVVAWNLLLAVGIHALCRNTLHNMETM